MSNLNQGFEVAGGSELLTVARFSFAADNRVQQRAILEITGLSVECPPANNNAVLGSAVGGQSKRQATPTRQKFNVLSLKLVATDDTDLFDWYTACNNESGSQDWQGERQGASVIAYSQIGDRVAEWQIINAYPCKYSGPEFAAGDETMANEGVDIVYEDFARIL